MNYGLRYRPQLDPYVAAELEGLIVALQEYLGVAHEEDGTQKDPTDTANNLTPRQVKYVAGPVYIEDAGHVKVDLAAVTYDDFGPEGINNAVMLEIEPGGAVSLSGIVNPDPEKRRLMWIRNRDSTNSVTLLDEDTGSAEPNRFSCPDNADFVVGPDRTYLSYYDPPRKRWTVVGP
jgi:hypothetical protein